MFVAIAISDHHAVHATEIGDGIRPMCGTRLAGVKPTKSRDVSCKRCLQLMGERATEAATEIRAQRAALQNCTRLDQAYHDAMNRVVDRMTAAVGDYVEAARRCLFSAAMAQPCMDDRAPIPVHAAMKGEAGQIIVRGEVRATLIQFGASWSVTDARTEVMTVQGAPYAESAVRAWALTAGIVGPVDVTFGRAH